MPGSNRKSSYQTADAILDGQIKRLDGRTLRFLADQLLKVREREQSYKREAEALKHKLEQLDFKQHALEAARKDATYFRKENNRLKLLRTRHGLPVDAETARFGLFGWREYPQGGWKDFLSAHASYKEACERQKQVRLLFPFTHIANIENCDREVIPTR
jgi:hypothetical protein